MKKATKESAEWQQRALLQIAEAEELVAEAQQRAQEAERKASDALSQASKDQATAASMVLALQDCQQAVRRAEQAEHVAKSRAEQLKAKAKALTEELQAIPNLPSTRTVDEWAALSRQSRYKASQREREFLLGFLKMHDHSWRAEDISHVLDDMGLLKDIVLHTREGFKIYFSAVEELMKRLEDEEFGREFGMLLHFDMHLTIPKILRLTQAACKVYNKEDDSYMSKVLLRDPWCKERVLHVPRIAPPRHKLEKDFKLIYKELNVESAEDGRVAFTSFVGVVTQLMGQDPGTHLECRRYETSLTKGCQSLSPLTALAMGRAS